MTLFAK